MAASASASASPGKEQHDIAVYDPHRDGVVVQVAHELRRMKHFQPGSAQLHDFPGPGLVIAGPGFQESVETALIAQGRVLAARQPGFPHRKPAHHRGALAHVVRMRVGQNEKVDGRHAQGLQMRHHVGAIVAPRVDEDGEIGAHQERRVPLAHVEKIGRQGGTRRSRRSQQRYKQERCAIPQGAVRSDKGVSRHKTK